MQAIFRDTSNFSKEKNENDFEEEDIFIEVVYESFKKIGSEFLEKMGLLNEETSGIYRIFEIIECTMWSEMVLYNFLIFIFSIF